MQTLSNFFKEYGECAAMTSNHYIRPIGLINAPTVKEEERFFGGLPLTGDGGLFYSAVEIWQRMNDGQISRNTISLGELWEKEFGLDGSEIGQALERISDPRGRLAGLSFEQALIMGIVNVTPDSFSDGGQSFTTQDAVDHALRLEDEGADILDIGGESTRPNAAVVSVEDELKRVMPVIEALAGRVDARISIDTRKAQVMQEAVHGGADMINDVSALTYDEESLMVAANCGVPVILMHAQGVPQTMQDKPAYENVLLDVFDYLSERIEACVKAGISRSQLIVDPGIGFGKTVGHNLELIHSVSLFHGLGVPILMGASRKGFIGEINQQPTADLRLPGSLSVALSAVSQGIQIVRVHDVRETRQALDIWRAIGQAGIIEGGV